MAAKNTKSNEANTIEKHLSSKLFQKFLQKEGNKLSDAAILPQSVKPEKIESIPNSKKKSLDRDDYYEEKKPAGSSKFSENIPSSARSAQRQVKKDDSPQMLYDDMYISNRYSPDSPREDFPKQQPLKFQDNPEDKFAQKFQDYPEEKPKFQDYPKEKPVARFQDYSEEKPAQRFQDYPKEKPVARFQDYPEEKPAKRNQDYPKEKPVARFQDYPEEKPGQRFQDYPDEKTVQRFQEYPKEKSVARFQDYPEEKALSRNKWQDPEPYKNYKEEVSQDNFYSRDSELKGFSDYIPPGESFVYFESIPENPPPKPKIQPYTPYYPVVDPLIAINANNQQIKELEERLKEKDEEIYRYKQDLENARLDYSDLEEKFNALGDVERKLKNLRVERDMFERKARSFEDENQDLLRQLDISKEDIDNARFKVEDIERANRNRVQDLERELRGYKDRISELERELSREKDKNNSNNRVSKKRNQVYEDDYRNDDSGYDMDYDSRDNYPPYEEKRNKYSNYDDDSWKPNRKNDSDSYPEKQKKGEVDFYDKWYQDKGNQDKGYQDKGYQDKGYQDNYDKKPEKFSDQVKARIGAGNSSSKSSVLNWGEKPKKNEEILGMENKILSLQVEKKRFEEELAKIPEHAKKIAVIRRREEIENELNIIHSNIANLKIKVKQIQANRT